MLEKRQISERMLAAQVGPLPVSLAFPECWPGQPLKTMGLPAPRPLLRRVDGPADVKLRTQFAFSGGF